MANVCQPVSKSGNCSNHDTARSRFLSNVSGPVKILYQCKTVKAVCSSNVSKQNASNVSCVSKLVNPLTVHKRVNPLTANKTVCSTIVSKSNTCDAIIVSQHVKLLNIIKSMSSCNIYNRNVNIVKSISHHTKPLNVGKSDCSRNVSKPVICKSLPVKPLKDNKSMSSCNVLNRNVHIVNTVSHHTKPLNVGKFDCYRNVIVPVIR